MQFTLHGTGCNCDANAVEIRNDRKKKEPGEDPVSKTHERVHYFTSPEDPIALACFNKEEWIVQTFLKKDMP
jgi:hypothetical protein